MEREHCYGGAFLAWDCHTMPLSIRPTFPSLALQLALHSTYVRWQCTLTSVVVKRETLAAELQLPATYL
jgi:hypothetical protein